MLDKGLVLPENYVFIKTSKDHYSFQTSVPIKPE